MLLPLGLKGQEFNLSFIDQDAAAKSAALKKSWSIPGSVQSVPTIDITSHHLRLTLDPAVRYVSGSVTTWFRPLTDDLREITFDLSDSLTVADIRYHGEVIGSFVHEGDKLTVVLPGAARRTTDDFSSVGIDSITISWSGIPPDNGSDSFSLSNHNGFPVLYTLSEPYGARDWWPCWQDLNDKVDSVRIEITTPAEYRVAANGMLIKEVTIGDSTTYTWLHKHPIAAYLIGVSVTNYQYYSDYVPGQGFPNIEILNYVYPENLENARSQTRQIIKPFQIYNELFGLYPFADERYGHAQWNWGGGMEHQTMSFMGGFGYDLMAHELAHQWFGDFITCGSWKDVWLNEGFATYLTGLCYERDQGGIYWEPFKRLSINRVIREPGGSVYCYDTTSIDRIFDARLSYSKGAMVLHMLRWEMGDDGFFRALNEYLHDPVLANGYARTEDLIRHAEAVADTSFTEFFNDWIFGQGYPKYYLIYRHLSENGYQVELSQEPSDPSVNFFEMHVPLRFYGQGRDTTLVFHHTAQGQLFNCSPGLAVDSVKLDPDRWICTANPVVLNIQEIPVDKRITIYPNPVSGKLYVDCPVPLGEIRIKTTDISGKILINNVFQPLSGRIEIPVDHLKPGIYFVKVESDGLNQIATILKE